MDAHQIAATLRDIARRLDRLPAYSNRNPHAWHEGKSDIVAEVARLAEGLTARPVAPPLIRELPDGANSGASGRSRMSTRKVNP